MQQAVLTKSESQFHVECMNGNPRAQTEFYKKYYRMMFNSAFRILRNKVEAEDIMQESFITAFRRLDEVIDINRTVGWVKKIVVNKSINELKKNKRYLDEWNDNIEIEDFSNDEIFNQTDVNIIQRTMQELPDGYRVILSLYLIEGYDHSEIGEILNITSSTSRSQYTRAKKKLREIINKKYGR